VEMTIATGFTAHLCYFWLPPVAFICFRDYLANGELNKSYFK